MSRILGPLSAKHGQIAFGLICSAELTLALALLAYREYASALVTAFLGLSIALCWWSWTQAYRALMRAERAEMSMRAERVRYDAARFKAEHALHALSTALDNVPAA